MMCPRCGNRITNVRLGYKKQIGWRQTLSLRCMPAYFYVMFYSIKSLPRCVVCSRFMRSSTSRGFVA